jgi:hypothetical protein
MQRVNFAPVVFASRKVTAIFLKKPCHTSGHRLSCAEDTRKLASISEILNKSEALQHMFDCSLRRHLAFVLTAINVLNGEHWENC